MSKQSQAVAVRIAGHEYKIKSDGDADSLREIARHVDRAMQRVRERTGTVDTLDVAVLTCLNLAREIVALRSQSVGATVDASQQDARIRSLIDRVEAVLGEPSADRTTSVTPSPLDRPAEPARTIELPSVESLRDRSDDRAAAAEEERADSGLPRARVAAGGRDRAS